jgi:ribokinase
VIHLKTLSIGHLTYDINLLLDSYPIEGSKTSTKEIVSCSGGSANIVAYALAKWNMESYISGVLGYDEYGNAMRKDMEENKVHTNYLDTNYDIKTPTSYILSSKQNKTKTIVTAQKDDISIRKYEYDQDMDCVIADGHEYNASVYAFNKYANAISILNAKTPRKALLDFFKYAKYVVCSLEVAEAMTGIKVDFNSPITMSNVYKKIKDRYPNIKLLIRMEGKGCIYEINGEIKVLADLKDDGLDRTGTHDVFVASVAYGLTNKYDLETTIRLATIASSLAKKNIGATLAIPLLSDVISFYESKFGKLVNPNNVEESNVTDAPAA